MITPGSKIEECDTLKNSDALRKHNAFKGTISAENKKSLLVFYGLK